VIYTIPISIIGAVFSLKLALTSHSGFEVFVLVFASYVQILIVVKFLEPR
jgi:hypothetical protein